MKPTTFHSHVIHPVLHPARIRRLCTKPYPHHPKGCPNWGRRNQCPPDAPLFGNFINTDESVWALWAEFDLGGHIKKMQERHPTWSRRQLVCCIYWQHTVRKFLRQKADEWMEQYAEDNMILIECPEAMGMDMTATMKQIGVHLEWPPQHTTRMIYVVGEVR